MQPGLQSLLKLSSISLAARCRLEQVAFLSNVDLNDKHKDWPLVERTLQRQEQRQWKRQWQRQRQ